MTKPSRKTAPVPRRSPRQDRSAATVAALLEAAAQVLEADGLEGYTTNAIARRAGVSIGSLYQYFPHKDAITQALIARESQALLSDLEGIAASATEPAALDRIISVAVARQLRRPALARLLDVEELRLPAGDVQRVGERVVAAIGRCLAGSPFGDAASDPFAIPDLVAIIKGLVDGAGSRGEGDGPGLEARVRRAVFGYLQPRTLPPA